MLEQILSSNKYIRNSYKVWKAFRPIRKGILFLSFIVVLITLLIIVIYPNWLSSGWLLYLLPPVFLAVLNVGANSAQIFYEVYSSIKELEHIEDTLRALTDNSIRILGPKPKGIPEVIQREETASIFELLLSKNAILLTGEAGTGKSGIAVALSLVGKRKGYFVLLVDARRLTNIHDPVELAESFDLRESVINCIKKICENTKFLLVIDQLDDVVGTDACNVILDFLINCSQLKNASAVAISRHREANEQEAIRPLLEAGFEETICQSLDEELTIRIIQSVGVDNVSGSLLELANNLLNLDIICEIVLESRPDEVTNIEDEISLWEKYRLTIRSRENHAHNNGDEFVAEAVSLARIGLGSIDRSFDIEYPPTLIQNRLKSGNIITRVSGRKYQFRRDKLQDYLYAWDACERNRLLENVYEEIGNLHSRNVILLMRDIYEARREHDLLERFLEGIFDE